MMEDGEKAFQCCAGLFEKILCDDASNATMHPQDETMQCHLEMGVAITCVA